MSARLAWHRPTFRVLTILLILFVVLMDAVFLGRTIPVVRAASTVILHYNVYLGIDDVRWWGLGISVAGIMDRGLVRGAIGGAWCVPA